MKYLLLSLSLLTIISCGKNREDHTHHPRATKQAPPGIYRAYQTPTCETNWTEFTVTNPTNLNVEFKTISNFLGAQTEDRQYMTVIESGATKVVREFAASKDASVSKREIITKTDFITKCEVGLFPQHNSVTLTDKFQKQEVRTIGSEVIIVDGKSYETNHVQYRGNLVIKGKSFKVEMDKWSMATHVPGLIVHIHFKGLEQLDIAKNSHTNLMNFRP